MSAKFKEVPYFKFLLRLKAPTARVQTMLKMFLRQCTLRLGRSAKFPLGGGGRASSQGTMSSRNARLVHQNCISFTVKNKPRVPASVVK
jgi:hypothetical protein